MEIDAIWSHARNSKQEQLTLYNTRTAPADGPMYGYIGAVTPLNNLTNTYTVILPSMSNTILDNVTRIQSDAVVGANGVGHRAQALRPGQPVLIEYFGRSRTPIITGSTFLNGATDKWKEGTFPAIDSKDEATGNAIYPVSSNPVFLALEGDAEIKVSPFIAREKSPNQPAQSPAQVEVPGNWYIEGSDGHVYETIIGQKHTYIAGEVGKVSGPRASLSDIPINQTLQASKKYKYDLNKEVERFYTFLNGQAIPKQIRETADSLVGGQASSINKILTQVESLLTSFDTASRTSKGQLDFLKMGLKPIISKVTTKWGNKTISTGLINISTITGMSGSSILRINFVSGISQLDKYVNEQFTKLLAQVVNILDLGSYFGISDSPSKTLTTGVQPQVLQSEGGGIFGGLTGATPPFVPQNFQSVGAAAWANDVGTRVVGIVPYKLVQSSLNNLDFANYPHHAVAALLTRYGVPNAGAISELLNDFVKAPNQGTLIQLINTFVERKFTLQLTTAQAILQGNTENVSNIINSLQSSAAVNSCPAMPVEYSSLLTKAAAVDTDAINKIMEDFFLLSPAAVYTVAASPTTLQQWLEDEGSDTAIPVQTLLDGDVLDFVLQLIYLTAGLDLTLYPTELSICKTVINNAYVKDVEGYYD